ncbi:MAG: Solvent efflux pump outer membrane protein SrpC [Proteobacteria bacterium]|nr:Solvent efflux pump outer membrane protein SrpC [Pseudomonadota bacterium]
MKIPKMTDAIFHHSLGCFVCAMMLMGCGSTQVQSPTPDVALATQFRNADLSERDAFNDREWWSRFDDPILTELITKSLNTNYDVKMALSRIKGARAFRDAQSSRLSPSLDVQGSTASSHSGLPQSVKQGIPDTKSSALGLNVAWEIDLSGGISAAKDAAEADLLSAQYGVVGMKLLIASEVATQYFLLRSTEHDLKLMEALSVSQHGTLHLTTRRFNEGLSSELDLQSAIAEANEIDAKIPPLRMLIASLQTQLALLLGENPSTMVIPSIAHYDLPKSPLIGTAQPLDLLKRRPDLMAAESHYAAESLRTEEARSQYWPKLFLNALLGREDLRLNGLNLAPVNFSNVALTFAMPIFNAGKIQAGVEAQSSRENEALLGWQKSVLTALKEVEDSLVVCHEEQKRGEFLAQSLQSKRLVLRKAESLFAQGESDKLVVLQAQRLVLLSEMSVTDQRAKRLLADVQLYKALGGGWNVSKEESKEGTTNE